MIERETILVRAPDVRYRIVHDEGVVIRQKEGEALVLNEVGARILDLLDGTKTVAEVKDLIVAEYEVEPERLHADVERYLADLLDIGVLLQP